MLCASLLRIISRVISARALEMAAFSLQPDLAIEINRHFLANESGDLSFFFCCFELSNKFLCVKYGPIVSAEQKTIVRIVNLASNRD